MSRNDTEYYSRRLAQSHAGITGASSDAVRRVHEVFAAAYGRRLAASNNTREALAAGLSCTYTERPVTR